MQESIPFIFGRLRHKLSQDVRFDSLPDYLVKNNFLNNFQKSEFSKTSISGLESHLKILYCPALPHFFLSNNGSIGRVEW